MTGVPFLPLTLTFDIKSSNVGVYNPPRVEACHASDPLCANANYYMTETSHQEDFHPHNDKSYDCISSLFHSTEAWISQVVWSSTCISLEKVPEVFSPHRRTYCFTSVSVYVFVNDGLSLGDHGTVGVGVSSDHHWFPLVYQGTHLVVEIRKV